MYRGVIGWGETRQRTPSNAAGKRVIAAKVETPPMHRLNSPMIMSRGSGRGLERPMCVRGAGGRGARARARAEDVAALGESMGDPPAVGRAAETVIAQV